MGFKELKNRIAIYLDQKLAKAEEKGFKNANRLHRYGVNGCLIFIAYQFYVMLR
jgi:hypothetical protein